MDPIFEYLLEFNKTNPIKYQGRKLIPVGGLEEMLKNYKKFHLGEEEIESNHTPDDVKELYELLD